MSNYQQKKKIKQEYPANQQQYIDQIPQKIRDFLEQEPDQIDKDGVWDAKSEVSEKKSKGRLGDLYGFVNEYIDKCLTTNFYKFNFKYVKMWTYDKNKFKTEGLSFMPTQDNFAQIQLSFKKSKDGQLIPIQLADFLLDGDDLELIKFVSEIYNMMKEKDIIDYQLDEKEAALFQNFIPKNVNFPSMNCVKFHENFGRIWGVAFFNDNLSGLRLTFKKKQLMWSVDFKSGQGIPLGVFQKITDKNFENLYAALNICIKN